MRLRGQYSVQSQSTRVKMDCGLDWRFFPSVRSPTRKSDLEIADPKYVVTQQCKSNIGLWNPTLQKQYWVVKPNAAKPIFGCDTQCCKSNIGLQPNVAKAILGFETQCCKRNIGLQPNVEKAALGYNPMLQKQYWVATQCFKSNIGLQPNVSKATLGYNTQHCNCKSNIELQTQRCKEKLICYNPMLLCRATQCWNTPNLTITQGCTWSTSSSMIFNAQCCHQCWVTTQHCTQQWWQLTQCWQQHWVVSY